MPVVQFQWAGKTMGVAGESLFSDSSSFKSTPAKLSAPVNPGAARLRWYQGGVGRIRIGDQDISWISDADVGNVLANYSKNGLAFHFIVTVRRFIASQASKCCDQHNRRENSIKRVNGTESRRLAQSSGRTSDLLRIRRLCIWQY